MPYIRGDHTPVLLDEVLSCLHIKSGGAYIDATFGAGGYSAAILGASKCKVYGIDRDRSVSKYAETLINKFGDAFHMIYGEFGQLSNLVKLYKIPAVDGIVFDIGVSSMQLAEASRGFSFMHDGPLDMRMDQSSGPSAQYIVNNYTQENLSEIIFRYGGERKANKIAKYIVNARKFHSIESTGQLSDLIKSAVGYYKDSIHPATRTFQALRIEVNDELKQLELGLRAASKLLKQGGILAVVTFHSAEDFIVKKYFKELCGVAEKTNKYPTAKDNKSQYNFAYVNKKVITPTAEEVKSNYRARSAKLRAIKRVVE